MVASIRILYVGIDEAITEEISTSLETKHGSIETRTVPDATSATNVLGDRSFDCIVSTNQLDTETGIELLRSVRESFPDLPYILFTDTFSEELISAALEANVTDCVPRGEKTTRIPLLADQIVDVVTWYRTTERTDELKRINSLLRELNQELVRASTREEIGQRVCEILTRSEPYVFAWIGEYDPNAAVVSERAAAGADDGYLDEITITTGDGPTAQGPTGEAVRSREIQVMQNIPEDPEYEPWREKAVERGYKSSAAIPLIHEDTLYGVLNVYAERTNAFGANEQALLEDLGETIAYTYYELEMRKEVRRFRRAVEQAVDAVFITEPDGTIQYVNPAFEELTGYTASEAVGHNPRLLKSGEHSEEYYAEFWKTIRTGNIWQEEIINLDKSGDRYYAEQTIAPLTDESGDIDGFVAIQRDITDRKRREQRLERSRKRLRILFDQAPDGIIVHDIEGTIHDVNETIIESLEYSREELLSMSIFDIEVGIDTETAREQWQSIDPGSVHGVEIEGTHRRKDGSTYPAEIWISRVTLEEQESDQFIAFVRDISDRKDQQRQRREVQRRLALAVETADAGVWEWDVQAGDVIWEDSMETLLGLEPGTFDGTYEAFLERVHPEDRETIEQTIETALGRREGFEREFRLRCESGEYVWMLTRSRVLTTAEGDPERMIGVGIDISDRTDRTRQLQVLDRVLRHNLRNDMTVVQGYAETIRDETDAVDDQARQIVEKSQQLMETVDKEREIVDVIAENPDKQEIDIVDYCRRAVSDIREDYPNATIDFDHPEELSVSAITNIERAIKELVENALRHNDRERPELSLSIEPATDTVRVIIGDNGPGIPEKEVNVLTQEYEIDPLYHGSGLGLWLVNWIVKQSDGTLEFGENTPRGSVVSIELERAK